MSGGLVRRLIITWPKPVGAILPGCSIRLTDADTGEHIVTALNGELTVRMDASEIVTVELEMLVDADGQPLAQGGHLVADESGENVRTGRFGWEVAEMRIADE